MVAAHAGPGSFVFRALAALAALAAVAVRAQEATAGPGGVEPEELEFLGPINPDRISDVGFQVMVYCAPRPHHTPTHQHNKHTHTRTHTPPPVYYGAAADR